MYLCHVLLPGNRYSNYYMCTYITNNCNRSRVPYNYDVLRFLSLLPPSDHLLQLNLLFSSSPGRTNLTLVSQPFIVVLVLNLPPSWKDHACCVQIVVLVLNRPEFETAIRGNVEWGRKLFSLLLRFVRGTTPSIQRTYWILENVCVLLHTVSY